MKKILSILLVLTVLVNVIGFGFLNINASAELATAVGVGILSIVGGYVIGGLSGLAGDGIRDNFNKFYQMHEDVINQINNNGIQNGELIQIGYRGNADGSYNYWLEPVDSLTGRDRAFIQRICDSCPINDTIITGAIQEYNGTSDLGSMGCTVSASVYQAWKNRVTNAIIETAYAESVIEGYDLLGEEAANNLPDYDFDWTGPVIGGPSIPIPTSQGFKSNTIGGFRLLNAYVVPDNPNYFFDTEEQAHIYGATTFTSMPVDNNSRRVYTGYAPLPSNYGDGHYVIYNGEIYYKANHSHSNSPAQRTISVSVPNNVSMFVSANGVNLSDAGCTSLAGLRYGLYYCTDPNATTNYPVNVTQDDLIEETGGGELTIPVRDDENIIAQYIKNIGDPNSMLEIAPDGTITGADGITIEQIRALLNELVDQLDNDIDLSSLEEYLKAIEKAAENVLTAEQLNVLLNGLKLKIKDYSGDLSKILSAINSLKELDQTQADKLTSIEEQTKTIAEALTAEQDITADKKFDINTPSVITDKFPFSLPFDVYHVYNILSAEPVAPKFTFPLKMDGVFDYSFEVDLSEYEWIAVIVRWLLFIIFIVGLIIVTNKLIGRG